MYPTNQSADIALNPDLKSVGAAAVNTDAAVAASAYTHTHAHTHTHTHLKQY